MSPTPDSSTPGRSHQGPPRSPAQRLFLLVGSLGPFGHAPASGTVTVACVGIPLYWLMATHLSPLWYVVATLVFTLAAMAVHHRGDRILGVSDSRCLVWDELAGYLVAMFMIGWSWPLALLGFVVERALDILKPPPANWVDRHWHSGVGVVLDDVIAGLYTCGLLHLVRYAGWFGAGA